jgi:inhibitor of cysteine peptidase
MGDLIKKFLGMLFLLILLLGCTGLNAQFGEDQTQIKVKAGEEFNISLKANPTTGYGWQLITTLDPNILKLKSSHFEKAPTQKNLMGAGGHTVWTFKALGAGEANLLFHYLRPWEKNKQPARKKRFTVVVE